MEHVDAIARLKKEAITPRDMVNCLWEPMTHIVAATVATGKEQDIDLTLRTFQANMKIHTDMVDLAPAIMQNRVGNQDILTMLSSLKQAQSEDMNPLAYRHAEKDVRHYFSKIVQQDYTNVLSEHKKFIESNLYADAFGLLNRLNEGLDSQNDFDLLSDENPRLTMALHAYILCFNDIQIISATGLNGEKPEAFDALLNAVGTGLSQRNARIESLAVVSQNVGSSLQM